MFFDTVFADNCVKIGKNRLDIRKIPRQNFKKAVENNKELV
jgi:hypothetical protein